MTEEKTPAKTTTRAKKKPVTDWAKLAGRSATAPKEEIEREEASTAPAPAQPNAAVQVTATGKVIPVTKAQTFRLPLDALQIIADAKAEEAANGRRLTNDAAVTEALHAWAKARQRRKG